MSLFTIDPIKCTRDRFCVIECPLNIIELTEDAPVPTPVSGAEERCINCGHCVAVCPSGAFSLYKMNANDCPPVNTDMISPVEQTEYLLRSRRSIRIYENKSVERKKLAKLIDVARYSPTGTNSQQVSWIVINSREAVKKMSGMVVDLFRYMIKHKHPMAEAYHLENTVSDWEAGTDRISRGAPALVVTHAPKAYPLAIVDCTSALSYLDLAAPSLGLGTCWGGFFMLAIAQWPPILEALALPEGHACFGVMMVGYPKFKYHRLPSRNEPTIDWRE
jgi:nitroreductase/NAD-dependent dihydropyrimidine dehydrogenase PreA subunit